MFAGDFWRVEGHSELDILQWALLTFFVSSSLLMLKSIMSIMGKVTFIFAWVYRVMFGIMSLFVDVSNVWDSAVNYSEGLTSSVLEFLNPFD